MANEILEDVLRAPRPNTYAGLKERAIESTRTRILLRDILKRNCAPTTFRSPFQQFQRPANIPFFRQNRGVPQQRAAPQYTSSNAPPSMRNVPIPMDTGARARTPGWQGRGNWCAQGRAAQIEAQVPTCRPLICFGCGKSGHVVALCPNQDYGQAAQQGVQQAQFTCFNCGKKGHMARNCMQRKRTVAVTTRG
jgi:Zinc knuckle